MQPSAALCRSQQAYHRNRAATAVLDNVRVVAQQAAAAWDQEAIAAERREERHERTKATAAVIALQKADARAESERSFSENPDRGFADA